MPNFLDEAHRDEILLLSQTIASRTEWPTWLLLIGFYSAWCMAIFGNFFGEITTIVFLMPLVVLWMSIQHELIHGHPTKWAVLNKVLGYIPFAIWYPYALYKDTHLAHHQNEGLTFPEYDPESRYISIGMWQGASKLKKVLLWMNKTMAGRLLIGVPLALLELIILEFEKLINNRCNLRMWFFHILSVGLLLVLVECYSPISAMQYLFLVAVPALSIAMIRSFYEHRPSPLVEHRTVITESSGPLSWVFLNLNLHLVHHDLPGLPWFYLPRAYQARRAEWIARNNGFVVDGYYELFRHYFSSPIDCPVHPEKRLTTKVHGGARNDTF